MDNPWKAKSVPEVCRYYRRLFVREMPGQERAFICALTKEVVITGASRMNALLCQRYMERYENGRPPAGKTDARPPYRKGDTPRARVYHGCVCSHLRFLYSVFS